jgi:peptidoglycan-N-acetylglucosamine deacetylase
VIIRRLAIGLVLVLFVSTTVWAVLSLDRNTSRALVGLDPDPGTVASPSAEPSPSSAEPSATPKRTPTTKPQSESTTSTPKPSATKSSSKSSQSSSKKSGSSKAKQSSADSDKSTKDGRTVYLTFDDGPGPYTRQVLEILRDTGSTATFFQLGINAEGEDEINDAIEAQGSNIANHSYSHPDLTTLSAAKLRYQIANGPKSKCFRPPYGATNARVRKAIAAAGARQVLWTVDTLDWQKPGVGQLEYYGKSKLVQDGGIILMHDGGGEREQTVAALPEMIKGLKARGFKVRALPYC